MRRRTHSGLAGVAAAIVAAALCWPGAASAGVGDGSDEQPVPIIVFGVDNSTSALVSRVADILAGVDERGAGDPDSLDYRDRGLLDIYGRRINPGFATFDTKESTLLDAVGEYSYGPDAGPPGNKVNIGARGKRGILTGDFDPLVVPSSHDLPEATATLTEDIISELPSTSTVVTDADCEAPTASSDDDACTVTDGRPVAAFLHDMDHLYTSESVITGDAHAACRDRFVVLLLSGTATSVAGTKRYDDNGSVDAALDILRDDLTPGVKVYLVGYALNSTQKTRIQEYISDLDTPTAARAEFQPEFFAAEGDHDLPIVISGVLNDILAFQSTRTKAAFTSRTRRDKYTLFQFNSGMEADTVNSYNIRGILQQQIFGCISSDCNKQSLTGGVTGAGLCSTPNDRDLQTTLSTQSTRDIRTIFEGESAMTAFAKTNSLLVPTEPRDPVTTPDPLEVPDDGRDLVQFTALNASGDPLLPTESGDDIEGCRADTLTDSTQGATRTTFREELIDYVAADSRSCRGRFKLGGIFHSTPVIQANLDRIRIADPSFQVYREFAHVKERPTVLWTATHEGVIHGFRVDRQTTATSEPAGTHSQEIFAYVPAFVLPRLKKLTESVDFLLDGVPTLREILLFRKNTELTSASVTTLANRWRSVLVVPGGWRTPGIAVLDVTDMGEVATDGSLSGMDPKVMWELTPEKRCTMDTTGMTGTFDCTDSVASPTTFHEEANDYSLLGKTNGKVAVGTVFVKMDGETAAEERAVAVIAGGMAIDGVTDSGKAVYVVDLETGEGIARFPSSNVANVVDDNVGRTGSNPLDSNDGLDAEMIGTPVCFNTFPGTLMSRCLIGDAKGQLWYLHFDAGNDNEPDNWRLRFFHDAYSDLRDPFPEDPLVDEEPTAGGPTYTVLSLESDDRRGIWEPPAIALDRSGRNLIVAYHTSRIEDVRATHPQQNRLISLTENFDATDGITAEVNWVRVFPEDTSGTPDTNGTTDSILPTGPPLIFNGLVLQTAYRPKSADCDLGRGELIALDMDGDQTDRTTDSNESNLFTDGTDAEAIVDLGVGIPLGVQTFQRPTCQGTGDGSTIAELGEFALPPGGRTTEVMVQSIGATTSGAQQDGTGEGGKIKRITKQIRAFLNRIFKQATGSTRR